jgi:superfamily I DNA/RNA helicase
MMRHDAPSVTLSPEQVAVVAHGGSDLRVIACEGSGKTESISRPVAAIARRGKATTMPIQ